MPFDATPTELKPIDKLIQALRGPEPSDWDFRDPCHCGIAVAERIGIWRQISMPREHLFVIFGANMTDDQSNAADIVRPRHVADSLEHYRDKGEALSPFEFVKRERG